MKMPTGDFKGIEIYKLPTSYLEWIIKKREHKSGKDVLIWLEANKEYQFREKMGLHWEEEA